MAQSAVERDSSPAEAEFLVGIKQDVIDMLSGVLRAQMSLGVGNDRLLYSSTSMFPSERLQMEKFIGEMWKATQVGIIQVDELTATPKDLRKSMTLGGFYLGLTETDKEVSSVPEIGNRRARDWGRGFLLGLAAREASGETFPESCLETKKKVVNMLRRKS